MAKTINEIFNSARDGADNVKQIIKVKRTLGKCEDELAALLYELGCEVYEGSLSGETDEEAIQKLFAKIGALRSNIKRLTAEYNALNGKVLCESCGNLTSSSFDFCPFCGAKLFEVVIDEEQAEEAAEEPAEEEFTPNDAPDDKPNDTPDDKPDDPFDGEIPF